MLEQQVTPSPLALAQARRICSQDYAINRQIDQTLEGEAGEVNKRFLEEDIRSKADIFEALIKANGDIKQMRSIIKEKNEKNVDQMVKRKSEASQEDEWIKEHIDRFNRKDANLMLSYLTDSDIDFGNRVFLSELGEAFRLGDEKGLDVSKIFEEDALYRELKRQVHTPLSVALGVFMPRFTAIPYFCEERVKNRAQLDLILLKQDIIGNTKLEDIDLKAIDKIVDDDFKSGALNDKLHKTINRFEVVYRLKAGFMLERFWTPGEIAQSGVNELYCDFVRTRAFYQARLDRGK